MESENVSECVDGQDENTRGDNISTSELRDFLSTQDYVETS